MNVDYDNKQFVITCHFVENGRVKDLPDRTWDKKSRVWIAPALFANAKYILDKFKADEITPVAQAKAIELKNTRDARKIELFPAWHKFKTPPRKHQTEALNKMWPLEEGALFMGMRTGKSFVAINLAVAHACNGDINALIIVCESGVKPIWPIELEKHCPIPYNAHLLQSHNKKKTAEFIVDTDPDKGLKVLIVGIEALSQGSAKDELQKFLLCHNAMMVVDESTSIKNSSTGRTKRAWDLGGLASYRWIMTGTSITQGMEDLFAQFRFLNWQIIEHKSYYTFRNRYCVMGGFEGRKVVDYNNVDELIGKIIPYTYQILSEDAIDMPERIYEQRHVALNTEQKRLLGDLGDPYSMRTELGNEVLEPETILERMTRYQQIVGGHFPFEEKDDRGRACHGIKRIPGKNPKFEEMKKIISEIRPDEKVIIWARFVPELELIEESLKKTYSENAVVKYRGGMTDEERIKVLQRFQADPSCRFFVGNQVTGGMGLELSAASIHIYYSNTFSLKDREQSEARTNSDLQKSPSILYIDLIADRFGAKTMIKNKLKMVYHKVDYDIVNSLARKKGIADFVKEKIKEGQIN